MGSINSVKPDYVLKPLPDNGTRGYRVELDEFMADNDLVNLFLIALSEMQKNSLKEVNGKMNLLNYYALAAIHGKPSEDWNNYPNTPKANGKDPGDYGYCHHGIDTFPTWHRPYMMMYERAIYEEMLKQADKYTDASDKAKYHAAAERFRLPYFDPIMPRYKWNPNRPLEEVWGVPEIMRTPNVWVRKFDSPKELKQIPNPLYSFQFPSKDDFKQSGRKVLTMPDIDDIRNGKKLGTYRFNQEKTVRTPNNKGETNNADLEDRFRSQAVGLAVSLWQMLSPDFKDSSNAEVNATRPWSSFANHTYRRQNKDTVIDQSGRTVANVSIESWHDGIHVAIGGGNYGYSGQMGFPELAGFDPIFWMHHNNIDRLLSLHQAMYGQANMGEQASKRELKPFAKSADGTCYISSDPLVANYWSPGFAVPGSKESDPKTIKQTISQYITETYYWAINNAGDSSILKSWPQPMQYSEALKGNAAEKRKDTITDVTAVNPETANLVHREVHTTSEAKMAFKDEPIALRSTMARVAAIGNAMPDDAFWTPEQQAAAITESWNAHIRVRKFAFNRSFAVHVFVGHVENNQAERFYTKKNEIGFSGIFASGEEFAAQCSSCQSSREQDIIYEDVVPLTTQLTDYLASNPKSKDLISDGEHKTIASLEPEHVIPFLREQLQWRMVDINGVLLSGEEQMAQLEVTVTGRNYEAPTPEHIMGTYGEPTIYPEITNNKAGGLGFVYP